METIKETRSECRIEYGEVTARHTDNLDCLLIWKCGIRRRRIGGLALAFLSVVLLFLVLLFYFLVFLSLFFLRALPLFPRQESDQTLRKGVERTTAQENS